MADDVARAKAWWGDDVTSFHDGSSTSAPLTGVNYNAVYDECPGVAYAGIALEYGTLPVMAVLQALRGDQWLQNHPDAPDEVRAPIKRAGPRRASTRTPTTGSAWCTPRRVTHVRRAIACLAEAR